MKIHRPSFVLIFLTTLIMAVATSISAMEVGVGQSNSKDAKASATEASNQAKKGLGQTKAKLVLVYHSSDLFKTSDQVLEGVASVFDRSIVYGCSGYAPLTHQGNNGQVAVLAVGGDVEVTLGVAETAGKDDDLECGRKIGTALKQAAQRETTGRVVLLFGDCHVPRDDNLAKGVCSVLGKSVPLAGGAAWNGRCYVAGETREKTNIGILLTGDFTCGVALKKDNSPKGLITSASEAFQQAIGNKQDQVVVTFVFDCGGRRGSMLKNGNFGKEIEAMREVAGDSPIFGFYGSGEIGCPSMGEASCGVGYHISTCSILRK